jgi:hypothetical protein
MMSKVFSCLFMIAVIGVAVIGSPPSTEASNLPARGGKSDFPISEPGCWGVSSGTVQNVCSQAKFWWMPLINVGAGSFWVTVTAEAANNNSNVQCSSTGCNHDGTSCTSSGSFPLPQFGLPRDINLSTSVPSGGTGMVDCQVNPGGKIHTLNW